ncbi:MAG: hypothetical protein AB1717_02480 [Pseudomonadota bacterium]
MKRDLLTVRVESDLKHQYQQVAELRGLSASDSIRRHMQETVQQFLKPHLQQLASSTAPQPAKPPVRPPQKPAKRKRR